MQGVAVGAPRRAGRAPEVNEDRGVCGQCAVALGRQREGAVVQADGCRGSKGSALWDSQDISHRMGPGGTRWAWRAQESCGAKGGGR